MVRNYFELPKPVLVRIFIHVKPPMPLILRVIIVILLGRKIMSFICMAGNELNFRTVPLH